MTRCTGGNTDNARSPETTIDPVCATMQSQPVTPRSQSRAVALPVPTGSLPSVAIRLKPARNVRSASASGISSPLSASNSARNRASASVMVGQIGAFVGGAGRCASTRNAKRTRRKMFSRARSMLPPPIPETLLRQRRKLARLRPRSQQRSRESQKFARNRVASRRQHRPQPHAKRQPLQRAVEFSLYGVAPVVKQVMMQLDLYWAYVGARAAQRTRVWQMRPFVSPAQVRRDDRTDRALIRRTIAVSTDSFVDRAHVQART